MADNAEALDLRRRARRRLIGAIALVLALVIVPPWLMDLEPRPVTTDLKVEIPAQETNRLKPPAAAAKAPEPTPAPAAALAKPEKPDAAAKAEAKPAPPQAPDQLKAEAAKPPAKAETVARAAPPDAARKGADASRAEAILNAEAYVVPLGAFANKENVKQLEARLAKAGVKHYAESVAAAGGGQTRVRAGPFPTREAAEQARETLKGMGLAPGPVAARQ
jgi:DedD protein